MGVEPPHGVVQDQATFDGLEAISDERGVDGIEGILGRQVGVKRETGASTVGRTNHHSQGIEEERSDGSQERGSGVVGAGCGEGVDLEGDDSRGRWKLIGGCRGSTELVLS